ncbi:hypothetical protein [Streptomyces naphthomycinicus]|uniref:hypothetical protein n=1 Tax=Streptomyces naphthomycinicus TaxID=2872625 RepID=UPI001CED9F84|nr:hypothetical protein [Streptomyces sp. TML10]
MPLDEDFEPLMTRTLGSAADAFPPHSADLVRRSVARGRRMRLLAATRIAGTAVAVAAVGGTLTAMGAFGGHGAGAPDQLRAGAPGGSSGQPSSRVPSPVSGEDMIRTLKSLLPSGGTVSAATGRASQAGPPVVWPTAKLTYSTPKGSSGIDITLARLEPGAPGEQRGQSGCLPVEVRPYDKCTTRKLPGGAVLDTTESFTYPSSDTGQKRWYVVLTTADGVQLTAQEFGGGDEKGSSGAADPQLSLAQLTSIVRSPAWKEAADALPAPEGAPAGTPSTGRKHVSGARINEVVASHLPGGGKTSGLNAGDGLVQLVHDDGRGRSMVEVDAQYGMTDDLAGHMGCAGVRGHCEATELSDGTRVKKVQGPSEKGGEAQVWLVDVLYPDGRRVAARSVNSYAESAPVTRPRPVLSMAELESIALDKRFFTA